MRVRLTGGVMVGVSWLGRVVTGRVSTVVTAAPVTTVTTVTAAPVTAAAPVTTAAPVTAAGHVFSISAP